DLRSLRPGLNRSRRPARSSREARNQVCRSSYRARACLGKFGSSVNKVLKAGRCHKASSQNAGRATLHRWSSDENHRLTDRTFHPVSSFAPCVEPSRELAGCPSEHECEAKTQESSPAEI